FTGHVTVAIGANPGGGALAGTASVAAVSGVATFSDLSINRSGTGYTLTAGSGGLSGASTGFNIAPAAASELVFSVEPTSTAAGATITPAIQVTAQDAQGNTATGYTGTVTLAIGTNPGGGTLSGTTAVAAVGGVVVFPGLRVNKAGTGYTLAATATGFAGVASNPFTVAAGAATQVVFTVQPSAVPAGAAITPAVQVTAEDALGNTDPAFSGTVTVAIGANPGGGTLSGTSALAAVGGAATFADLSINKVGTGYTLTAAALGFT